MSLSLGLASKSPFWGDQEGRGIPPADSTPLSKALDQSLPIRSLLPFLGGNGKGAVSGREVMEPWQKRGGSKGWPEWERNGLEGEQLSRWGGREAVVL